MLRWLHFATTCVLLPCRYSIIVAPPHQSKPLASFNFDEIINDSSPHIGFVNATTTARSLEVFVIGTSHFICNSAQEVTQLIEQVQPDGVVLELDPERVIRLSKRFVGFDAFGNSIGDGKAPEDMLYGADFFAAINTCQRLDIPMFLGDEYVQETTQRLTQQLSNWGNAYSPAPLLQSIHTGMKRETFKRKRRINIRQSFVNDPQKLTPLVVASSPALVFSSALAFFDNGAIFYDGFDLFSSLGILDSLLISFLVICYLFNQSIVERDKILVSNTMKAYNVLKSLKDNKSIRKRWNFAVKDKHTAAGDTPTELINESQSLPLFTLKSPLRKGVVRNLNLFEPRWLKMIDNVTKDKDSTNENKFGCVQCTNKFYSAVSVNGAEGRYADVIFENDASYAQIIEIKEGKRSVSGDRKVNVLIEGGDSFVMDASHISISNHGYMVASQTSVTDCKEVDRPESGEKKIRLVVVVGLLHGNGVVELLSKV
jgi:hypothetical protein